MPGSRVGNQGKLLIDFVNGGTWQVPLSPDNEVSNPAASAPLIIEPGGAFAIKGKGVLLASVNTELSPGDQQKYVLVEQKFADKSVMSDRSSGLNLDLSALSLQSDKPDYRLTLEQENDQHAGYLYATLAHPEERIPSHQPISPDDVVAEQEPVSLLTTATEPEPASPQTTTAEPEPASLQTTTAEPEPASLQTTTAEPEPASSQTTAAEPELIPAARSEEPVFLVLASEDPSTPISPAARTTRDSSFSQQLPVNMVDQILASRLLQGTQATSFCQPVQNSVWIGQCLDETDEPFSLWALPLYDHITGKDFKLDHDHIGFEANIRGLGLQLVRQTHWGNWGGGLFAGTGDINSTEFNTPIHDEVDYLGGLLRSAVRAKPLVINLGVTYLHSKHHLRQHNLAQWKSDSEIDVTGIQAGMAWPEYYGEWLITPAAYFEFWHTRQPGNIITADGNQRYVRSEGNQNYRQLPLSVTVQGPNLISGAGKKVRLIPQLDVRFIPAWGDRQLHTRVSLAAETDSPVLLSTPEMDKNSTEAGVGLQLARDLLDGILRYNARHSSHTLSQQISADIVWRF